MLPTWERKAISSEKDSSYLQKETESRGESLPLFENLIFIVSGTLPHPCPFHGWVFQTFLGFYGPVNPTFYLCCFKMGSWHLEPNWERKQDSQRQWQHRTNLKPELTSLTCSREARRMPMSSESLGTLRVFCDHLNQASAEGKGDGAPVQAVWAGLVWGCEGSGYTKERLRPQSSSRSPTPLSNTVS